MGHNSVPLKHGWGQGPARQDALLGRCCTYAVIEFRSQQAGRQTGRHSTQPVLNKLTGRSRRTGSAAAAREAQQGGAARSGMVGAWAQPAASKPVSRLPYTSCQAAGAVQAAGCWHMAELPCSQASARAPPTNAGNQSGHSGHLHAAKWCIQATNDAAHVLQKVEKLGCRQEGGRGVSGALHGHRRCCAANGGLAGQQAAGWPRYQLAAHGNSTRPQQVAAAGSEPPPPPRPRPTDR